MESLYIQSIALKPDIRLPEEDYLSAIPAVKGLGEITLRHPVTFLVGENGSGKSTLLEAIAVLSGFNPEGGTRNFDFATKETHSQLFKYMKLSRGPYRPKDGFFLRAESFYNVASEIDRLDGAGARSLLGSYGGSSLHEQSHGESFLSLVLNRFGGNGLYILDEPEAALSPSRQMTLLAVIHQLVKQDSQFLIATHSPILMAYPDSEIFLLEEGGICSIPYEETEHYTLTKDFLNHPDRMLRYLFQEDEN